MGTFFLRNDLGFLSFSYLSLKEVALDRRGMVTSPILYPKCMHRYMCMHSLTGKEGDLEVFLCEISNRKEGGELVTWELLVHLHQELLLFPLLPLEDCQEA